MIRRSLEVLILACGWALSASSAHAQVPNDGIEILARGPVHEAYAATVEQRPLPGPIIERQPPEPIEELPPDQKPAGDDVQWIPGYWAWDDERQDFIWISGFWRVPPPGRVWIPGGWRQVGNGFQWVGGFWSEPNPQGEIQYLPAPPQPVEVAPTIPAPSNTHIYVPGCWIWQGDRFVWRPGYWVEHRPGWVWIPAHYRWTPAGYVFIDGYWDFPLADRGMLFAPVYIRRAVLLQPTFVYTPTVVVRDDCMTSALFVRRGWGHYYFGDYFEERYTTVGFTPWVGLSLTATTVRRSFHYDPLFSYYRVTYRHDPYWNGGIHELYLARFRNEVPRPPRTFVQQNVVTNNITQNNVTVNNINNTTINNTTVVNSIQQTNLQNLSMVAPVTQVAAVRPQLRLQTLPPAVRQEQVQTARQLIQVAKARAVQENALVSAARPSTSTPGGPSLGLNGPALISNAPAIPLTPRKANLELPQPIVAKAKATSTNPAKIPPPPITKNSSNPANVGGSGTNPGTNPARSPVQPVNPSVNPLRPPVQPVNPSVNPVRPPVQPVNPSVQPMTPSTPSVPPSANPVRPPAQPVNPSVNPLRPPAQPQPRTPPTVSVHPSVSPTAPLMPSSGPSRPSLVPSTRPSLSLSPAVPSSPIPTAPIPQTQPRPVTPPMAQPHVQSNLPMNPRLAPSPGAFVPSGTRIEPRMVPPANAPAAPRPVLNPGGLPSVGGAGTATPLRPAVQTVPPTASVRPSPQTNAPPSPSPSAPNRPVVVPRPKSDREPEKKN